MQLGTGGGGGGGSGFISQGACRVEEFRGVGFKVHGFGSEETGPFPGPMSGLIGFRVWGSKFRVWETQALTPNRAASHEMQPCSAGFASIPLGPFGAS